MYPDTSQELSLSLDSMKGCQEWLDNEIISIEAFFGMTSMYQEPNKSVFSRVAEIIFEDSHSRTVLYTQTIEVVEFYKIQQSDTSRMLNQLCQCANYACFYMRRDYAFRCAGYLATVTSALFATDTIALSVHFCPRQGYQ